MKLAHIRRGISVLAAAALFTAALPAADVRMTTVEAATSSIADTYQWDTLAIGGGGFVSGIVTGKKVMYARTDVGGAYKYNYTTEKWEQLFGFLNEAERGYLSVDAMAVDPTDDNTVYFLCGCAYFSDAGTRIYKTTNGGKTFTYADVTDLIQVHGNGYGRQCGEAIAVDPDNPKTLYCGGDVTSGSSALIKSTDGGKTWKAVEGYGSLGLYTSEIKWPLWTEHMVSALTDDEYGNQNGVATVAIANGKVYVGTSIKDKNNFVVADMSDDKFSRVSTDFPADKMPSRINIDADGNLLITYINGIVFDRGEGGAYRYNVSTGKVTDITPATESNGTVSKVGAGFGGVFSDPNDSNKLVATTLAQWYSQSYTADAWDREAIAWGDRFFKSEDGGSTWKELTPGNTAYWNGPLLGEYIDVGDYPWIMDKAIHWCGAIVLDPQDSDRFWITSGNGIFTCGNTWDEIPQIVFHPNGVEEVVALDMVSNAGTSPVSVIGDYDGFVHSSVTASTQLSPSMSKATGGSASTAAIAQCAANPKVMARVAEGSGKGYYTTNGGSTWTEMTFANSAGVLAINQLKDGTYRLYQGGDGKLSYTDNWGGTWTSAGGVEGSREVFVQIDLDNPQYVYAYTAYYNAYWYYSKPEADFSDAHYVLMVSSDYGATFTAQDIVMYDQCDVANRIGYLGKGEMVIGAGWYGAYHVSGYGKTVEKLDSVFYCKTIGFGAPEKSGGVNTLYMYGRPTENDTEGIYRSTDAGATWVCINTDHLYGGTGNGNFLVGDMNTFGKVYMSTVGCGIVYGCISGSGGTTVTTVPENDVLWGDVNDNGSVELADAVLLARAVSGDANSILNAQGRINAAVTGNTQLTGADTAKLLKYLCGVIKLADLAP